jgi:putative membrane protein
MANERTFLAWIRTSIAVMAFGFVVERFGLFVRQFTALVGKALGGAGELKQSGGEHGFSAILGVLLVGLGAVMGILAFIRYKKVERQIDEDAYRPSVILDLLLAISLLVIACFLIVYLVYALQ